MVERSLQQPLARCFFSHCASMNTTEDEMTACETMGP